jgi:hypothetical protein
MKLIWFKPLGWIYRPVSWVGWLLVSLTIVFLIPIFLTVDSRSNSVSDTFYGVFPYFIPTLMALYWIASKTSLKKP